MMQSKLCKQSQVVSLSTRLSLRTSVSHSGVGEPMPCDIQITAMPKSRHMPTRCLPDISASIIRSQSRIVCGDTPRFFANFETVKPALVMPMRSLSPKVCTINAPQRGPASTNDFRDACKTYTGLTASFLSPISVTHFDARLTLPVTNSRGLTPIASAMQNKWTAASRASFIAHHFGGVCRRTLQSRAKSAGRIPLDFIALRKRLPNIFLSNKNSFKH